MTHKTEAIENYKFNDTDQLLLDTNILFFVYVPQNPTSRQVAVYSRAFAKMIEARCCIYVDVLIISEFINRCARWEYDKSSYKDFKTFRRSQDFKPVAHAIAEDVRRVLQDCLRVESGFESLVINDLIGEYAAGASDFNDQVLVGLCKRRGLKLVTDDGDFLGQGISVLTANKKLLP